jgi:hypothetical protein
VRGDLGAEFLVGGFGHLALGMTDDRDATHAEEMDREYERPQGVVGHAPARVAEDLGVTGDESEHAERFDPRVDTREYSEALGRLRARDAEMELVGVASVGIEDVGEW